MATENNNNPDKPGADLPAGGSDAAVDPLDGSQFEGSDRIEQALPKRWPGFSRRSKREREWLCLKTVELRKARPDLRSSEVQNAAEDALEQLYAAKGGEQMMRQFEELAPSSTAPESEQIDREVEIAAVRRLGPVRWLSELMLEKTNRRGFSASRKMVLSVFLQMAFGRERPEIRATHKRLLRGHTLLSWAHDYPDEGPRYTTLCESLEKMLKAKSAQATVHCNLELIRRLAELTDEKGRARHPDIGRVGIVDGMLVQSDVPQVSGKTAAHRAILRGPRRPKVQPVVYTNNGNISRFCHGYKLVLIADMATTLPLVWTLIPANGNEREATIDLLRTLFRLWPECPIEALVGDSLFDRSLDFAHELVFNWGVQPVFPTAVEYSRHLPHVQTNGVPQCACGQAMIFKDTDGRIYDAKKRAKEGIPRGQQAPRLDGRLRWKCANGRCKVVSTRPVDDPRLYTVFHRGGEHRLAYKRTAMLMRRNAVESLFASVKHLGLAGVSCDRPSWADDDEMDWLLSCGLLYQSARRLAHESDAYELAAEEAEQLRLLQQPTATEPAPGPTAYEVEALRAAREERSQGLVCEAPRSWGPVQMLE